MAGKLFTLEAVRAKHGDCLLLHWGDPQRPRLILVDGGPSGVYRSSLKKRLRELSDSRGTPLGMRLVMISHIDDDHIRGILDLTGEMEELRDAGRPEPFEFDGLWLNSFDDIVGNKGNTAAFAAGVGSASLPTQVRGAGAVIASVGQGRTLRDRARRMGAVVNGGDALITDGWIWDMGDGLSFQVVGPSRKRIAEFQAAWDKELRRKGWNKASDAASVAAYLDKSPYNLASTVVLAKLGSKTMLLTGDARGDDVIEGLREWGLLTGSSMKVDLLKVPHHGSDRNVETDFFRTVRADHYVVSGDGKHGNPEIATLEMIRKARGSDDYLVHATYRDLIDGHADDLDHFLAELPSSERRKFVFRDDGALSLSVDLLAELPD